VLRYRIRGLPAVLTDEVRRTLRSPGYGHPVMAELAGGTGPCRQCLDTFEVGVDRRLLFTHRPQAEAGTITAPGPVFIHEHDCPRYDAAEFPEGLESLPLAIEARADAGVVLQCRMGAGEAARRAVDELLLDPAVTHLYLRHAEAGCFIARVDRE
jgi:hypothetical protein